MDEGDAVPADALEDIAYLSRSENRVRLLETLASGPHSRRELGDVTGVSRTTLGRILGELEEHGWARRTTDGDYVATVTGEHVVEAFMPLVGAMQAVRDLGDAVAWLPADELSIGLQHFRDATVRRSQPHAPMEFMEYLAGLVRDATTFKVLTFLAPPSPVGEAMHAGVVEGRLTADHVLAGGLVEYLSTQSESPPHWREYVEAGARVYRYDGHIPCNVFIVDETVLVMNDRPEGSGAAIESRSETVREWAHDLIETHLEGAERVDAETFA